MDDIRRLEPDALSARLSDLADPPTRLWARGSLPSGPCVAIVGTRRADLAATSFAHALARDLVAAGFGVVSGGADGIDAAAHEGALAAGGRTWVVMPTPLARPYPAHHRFLFDRVLEQGGGWVSERAPDEVSASWHFLSRNRIIAALADATVVVQAPLKSGAMSTARAAIDLARPLYAVPASPWDPKSAGCARLLEQGALPCTGARDVAERFGRAVPPAGAPRPAALLDPEQRAVLEALGATPAPVHEIVRRTGLGVVRVRVALVRLAARDLADQRDGGWLAVA
ncbi:MAG: DNA-protecting protein DprA [Sandaracinaceae bacterium]|nr:DNA-protecting protein DprA [Sandaracinaceae bacterium]